ncbi:hypothetical protein RIF29_04330 [Crotalaria pallida]|uniref:Uncharacterized protein n=1 Tax=Crotalaria pallida TaxID=3830 RepID=A0AAN9J1N1_CROPI
MQNSLNVAERLPYIELQTHEEDPLEIEKDDGKSVNKDREVVVQEVVENGKQSHEHKAHVQVSSDMTEILNIITRVNLLMDPQAEDNGEKEGKTTMKNGKHNSDLNIKPKEKEEDTNPIPLKHAEGVEDPGKGKNEEGENAAISTKKWKRL